MNAGRSLILVGEGESLIFFFAGSEIIAVDVLA